MSRWYGDVQEAVVSSMPATGNVLLVCRNSLTYTKACVGSILRQSVPVNLLVIDNASTDGTSVWLRSSSLDLSTIAVPFQLSVSQAWNLGLEWFWNSGAREVLVLNNDTEIQPTTYSELHHYLAKHDVGMVTGVGVRDRGQYEVQWPEEFNERPHPDFSCFMLKRSTWETVGGFDEGCIGAYFEDTTFHVEAHRKGVKLVCIDLPFLHHASGTLKGAEEADKLRIQKCFEHNKQRFLEKYGCLPGTAEYEALFDPSTFGKG